MHQLLECKEDELEKLTDASNPFNIADALLSSGFPHIELTGKNRNLAYECILTFEVITKRIPMLDDLRQGLMSESALGINVMSLAGMHNEIKELLFPPVTEKIDLCEMKEMVKYECDMSNPDAVTAQVFLERYLCELNERGKYL